MIFITFKYRYRKQIILGIILFLIISTITTYLIINYKPKEKSENKILVSGDILSEKADNINSMITIPFIVPTTDRKSSLITLNQFFIFDLHQTTFSSLQKRDSHILNVSVYPI